MKVTKFTRDILKSRRDERDMTHAGWEFVGEGGGKLWELHRGGRTHHAIMEVRISASGRGLWIKTQPRQDERHDV